MSVELGPRVAALYLHRSFKLDTYQATHDLQCAPVGSCVEFLDSSHCSGGLTCEGRRCVQG